MRQALLIRTFSSHYRNTFGFPVGKVPVATGVPCPNRKHGGCLFCRPESFTPGYLKTNQTFKEQLIEGKRRFLGNRFQHYFLYFQQETCTAAPAGELLTMAQEGIKDTDCVGLILSTRPDYLDRSLLEALSSSLHDSRKECLFELGLQSMHDRSLEFLNRNHTVADFRQAVELLSGYEAFSIGVHLIFGIPGESPHEMTSTIQQVCDLPVKHLKLHHLQVIRNTPLHRLYDQGGLALFSREAYTELLVELLPLIPEDVVIHRLWASSHPDLLVAPKWNVLATHLSRELHQRMKDLGISQGCRTSVSP